MLKDQINQVMGEIFYSGNAEEMQKNMGKEEFSRAISMEGVQRTINAQLQNRLKLIATGQPIPEETELEAKTDNAEEVAKEEEVTEAAMAEDAVEEADTLAGTEASDLAEEVTEAEETEE